MSYAQKTTVSPHRSVEEIRKQLATMGCEGFAYAEVLTGATPRGGVTFHLEGRGFRLMVPLPTTADRAVTHTPTGKKRTALQSQKEWDGEVRRKWRALALVVKAKLVSVQDGIRTMEQEFLTDMLLDDGSTLWERTLLDGGLDRLVQGGGVQALLPEPPVAS